MPSTTAVLDLDAPEAILGTVLAGRYRLESVIAHQAVSIVYRAEHIHMRKAYAVRMLDRRLCNVSGMVERFEDAAVRSAAIDHPNAASVTDFGRLGDGSFYLVVEYVAGTRLGDQLPDGAPWPPNRVVHILRQIAEALSAAHSLGIVHGALAPWNVALLARPDDPDFVKVLDFGMVRLSPSELSQEPALADAVRHDPPGKCGYRSPEQQTSWGTGPRSDLYSLGRIGYVLLGGSVEAEACARVEGAQATLRGMPSLPERCDPELRELIGRLLDPEPSNRPQSAHDITGALDAIVRRWVPPSEIPPAIPGLAAAFPQRFRLGPFTLARSQIIVGVGALGVLLGMGGLIVVLKWLWPADSPKTSPAEGVSATRSVRVSTAPSVVPRLPRAVLVARAAVGDEEALALLRKRVDSMPSAENWLALGRGYARRKQHQFAMEAYENALRLAPALKSDEALLEDVRDAAKEETSAEAALRLAARSLDSAGADILYEIWVGTAQKTPTTQLARQMVYDSTVRAKASPALQVALDLRAADSCQAYEAVLSRVILHGDRRVVRPLKRLLPTTGCGPGEREDCYPCLRDDAELLEAAIDEASRRAEPGATY